MALAIIIALVLAAWILSSIHFGPRLPPTTLFIPDLDNNKKVLVAGLDRTELDAVLEDFRKLQGDDGAPITLEVEITGTHPLLVMFPRDIEPDLLMVLVNYLTYPEAIDLRTHSLGVLGQLTLTTELQLPTVDLVGTSALVYVPDDDADYDMVCVQVDGMTYENSFAHRRWVRADSDRMSRAVRDLRRLLTEAA